MFFYTFVKLGFSDSWTTKCWRDSWT